MFTEELIAKLNKICVEELKGTVSLNGMMKALAAVLNEAGVKLTAKNVLDWLLANGYIYNLNGLNGIYQPTEKGLAKGILATSFTDQFGNHKPYCGFRDAAKLFVVSILEEAYEPIRLEIERKEAEKLEQKRLKETEKALDKKVKEADKALKNIEKEIVARVRLGEAEALEAELTAAMRSAVARQNEEIELTKEIMTIAYERAVLESVKMKEAKRIEEIRKAIEVCDDEFIPSPDNVTLRGLIKLFDEHFGLNEHKFDGIDVVKILEQKGLVKMEGIKAFPTEMGKKQGLSLEEGIEESGSKVGQPYKFTVYNTDAQKMIFDLIKNL